MWLRQLFEEQIGTQPVNTNTHLSSGVKVMDRAAMRTWRGLQADGGKESELGADHASAEETLQEVVTQSGI